MRAARTCVQGSHMGCCVAAAAFQKMGVLCARGQGKPYVLQATCTTPITTLSLRLCNA